MPFPNNKYLGWVLRYFHAAEAGDYPPISAVLSIDHDWPLDPRVEGADVPMIAGATQNSFFQMNSETHALVVGGHLQYTVAGPAVGDVMAGAWVNAVGQNQRIFSYEATGAAVVNIPVIGATSITVAVPLFLRGGPAVYIPPGGFLSVTTSSVAGGATIRMRFTALVRPKSYPLRLP